MYERYLSILESSQENELFSILDNVRECLSHSESTDAQVNSEIFQKQFIASLLSDTDTYDHQVKMDFVQSLVCDSGFYAREQTERFCVNIAEVLMTQGYIDDSTVKDLVSLSPIQEPLLHSMHSYKGMINSFKNAPPAIPPANKKSMTLLLHGTWAHSKALKISSQLWSGFHNRLEWWESGSDFMDYLINDKNVSDMHLGSPFKWSGKLSSAARKSAALDLLNWLGSSPPELTIVAHSHGGNVAMELSWLLSNVTGKYPIKKLILLGTPIRYEHTPNMKVIEEVYCIYSRGDSWQERGARFCKRGEGRTLADSERIINVYADNNGSGKKPNHEELHERHTWKRSEKISATKIF